MVELCHRHAITLLLLNINTITHRLPHSYFLNGASSIAFVENVSALLCFYYSHLFLIPRTPRIAAQKLFFFVSLFQVRDAFFSNFEKPQRCLQWIPPVSLYWRKQPPLYFLSLTCRFYWAGTYLSVFALFNFAWIYAFLLLGSSCDFVIGVVSTWFQLSSVVINKEKIIKLVSDFVGCS